MSIRRKLKNRAKELLFSVHKLGLRCGVVVLRITTTSISRMLISSRTADLWANPSQLAGIEIDLDQQAACLRAICGPFGNEVRGNPHYQAAVSTDCGPGYGYIEAEALHCVVRSLKPKRIVEVGSGVSTYCILQAGRREMKPDARLPASSPIRANGSGRRT